MFATYNLYASIKYSEQDLEQYNNTHSCIKCDLSNAEIYGQQNSILDSSILIGSTLKEDFTSSSFTGSILTQSQSIFVEAMVSNFSGSKMQYADFSKASMSGSNFQNADLRNVKFKGANLSSSDFSNAQLNNANLDYSILIGSNLNKEQLKSVKSYYCAVLPDGSLAHPQYEGSSCRNN